MKKLNDGSQVPARCYYYLLEWRDSNSDNNRFKNLTSEDSLNKLDHEKFWEVFRMVAEEDFSDNCF